MENYFGAPSMRSSTRTSDLRESQTSGATGGSRKTHGTNGAKTGQTSWVRQGIRREAHTVRVMMYEHREIIDGTTLNVLAEDLLKEVLEMRLMKVSSHYDTAHGCVFLLLIYGYRMNRAPYSSSAIASGD